MSMIPEEHTEFVAMTWEGSFLDGAKIHFNENLNVLIGGRGTGKSTVIESLRYALGLEVAGDDAKKSSTGIVGQVLKSGTKISLLVRSYRHSRASHPSVVRLAALPGLEETLRRFREAGLEE